MPVYNLIEYSNNYSKTSGSLWQYFRDEPALTNADAIPNFHAVYNSTSFNFKQKIPGKTDAPYGRKDAEIMVPLKHLSNFWRTPEMPITNHEINLILTWSDKCVLFNDTKATTFTITDTKLYVPVVTLSTQDKAKLFQILKSGFKRTLNWNKYQLKVIIQMPNPYLDYLIDPSFQEVNTF